MAGHFPILSADVYNPRPRRGPPPALVLRRCPLARWQSGYAADCKSVNAGSIPTRASNISGNDSLIAAGRGHVVTVAAQLGTQSLVLESGWGA